MGCGPQLIANNTVTEPQPNSQDLNMEDLLMENDRNSVKSYLKPKTRNTRQIAFEIPNFTSDILAQIVKNAMKSTDMQLVAYSLAKEIIKTFWIDSALVFTFFADSGFVNSGSIQQENLKQLLIDLHEYVSFELMMQQTEMQKQDQIIVETVDFSLLPEFQEKQQEIKEFVQHVQQKSDDTIQKLLFEHEERRQKQIEKAKEQERDDYIKQQVQQAIIVRAEDLPLSRKTAQIQIPRHQVLQFARSAGQDEDQVVELLDLVGVIHPKQFHHLLGLWRCID